MKQNSALILISLLGIALTGCNNSSDDIAPLTPAPDVSLLQEAVIPVDEPLGRVDFAGGTNLTFSVGIGSGAYHYRNDADNVLYTVTDRGPNIPCDDSAELLNVADFCVDNGSVDNSGKIFPMPDFNPSIFHIRLDTRNSSYAVLAVITLKDRDGNPISGLTNPLQVTDTENGYDENQAKQPFDPEGVDTEGLVKLSDGSFWLVDEYAPSLIHADAEGQILNRVVPSGVEADLAAANYPVTGLLPSILSKRRLNRGIESIAVSPDEQFLYVALQSPLSNPDAAAYRSSRSVRLLQLSLQNGTIEGVVGQYIYVMDEPESFPLDNSTSQSAVKVSEMVALDNDTLIVLERITKHTKLYRVSDFASASNILNSTWDDVATIPTLEQFSDLTAANLTPLSKTLVFDSARDIPELDDKIEGIAILNDEYIALVNDNDFAIAGATTHITVKQLTQQLSQ